MKLWKGKIGVYNKWSELSYFLVKAVNTTSYVLNRVYNRYIKKTPHELQKDKKSNVACFHVFCYKCSMLNNDKDNLSKFESKSDEGIQDILL